MGSGAILLFSVLTMILLRLTRAHSPVAVVVYTRGAHESFAVCTPATPDSRLDLACRMLDLHVSGCRMCVVQTHIEANGPIIRICWGRGAWPHLGQAKR